MDIFRASYTIYFPRNYKNKLSIVQFQFYRLWLNTIKLHFEKIKPALDAPFVYVINLIHWKKKKEERRKRGWEEGSKEESLVDSAGGALLVVKWTCFCGHEPATLSPLILSPPHFPARFFHLLLLFLKHLLHLLVFLRILIPSSRLFSSIP